MPPLGKADGPLVVAVDNRLRQPHAGKRSAFWSYRQRPVRDKAAEPGDILRGLAPPRHAVHDRPTTGDRILEGAKDEPVRVDRLGVDADLDQVVYQGRRILAGCASSTRPRPSVSTSAWRLRPLIFLPAS